MKEGGGVDLVAGLELGHQGAGFGVDQIDAAIEAAGGGEAADFIDRGGILDGATAGKLPDRLAVVGLVGAEGIFVGAEDDDVFTGIVGGAAMLDEAQPTFPDALAGIEIKSGDAAGVAGAGIFEADIEHVVAWDDERAAADPFAHGLLPDEFASVGIEAIEDAVVAADIDLAVVDGGS